MVRLTARAGSETEEDEGGGGTDPPAPTPGTFEYFIAPSGSDTNSGLSWADAYRTPHKAAAVAPDGSRVWMASGTYTFTSSVTYSGKTLFWHGPIQTADQNFSGAGSVLFTAATAGVTRYFDVGASGGFGMKDVFFNLRGIVEGNEFVRLTNVKFFDVEAIYSHTLNPSDVRDPYWWDDTYFFRMANSTVDCDFARIRDCDARPSSILRGVCTGTAKARAWEILGPRTTAARQTDGSTGTALDPIIHLDGNFDGVWGRGGYLQMQETPTGSWDINMVGAAGGRRVTFTGLSGERFDAGSFVAKTAGVNLLVLSPAASHGAAAVDYYGTGTIHGYIAHPDNGYLQGDLVTGEM